MLDALFGFLVIAMFVAGLTLLVLFPAAMFGPASWGEKLWPPVAFLIIFVTVAAMVLTLAGKGF